MSDTLTSIANQALVSINKDPIKSLDDVPQVPNASNPSEKSAQYINIVIDQTIKWVQNKARWSDLITEYTLNLVEAPTSTRTNYKYSYPSDVLGYVQLISGAPYELRSGFLYTNDPEAILRYVRFSREPSEWNPFLTEAIITELAARIAIKLSKDKAIHQQARQTADTTLIDSTTSDWTNRATPRERGSLYSMNNTRRGVGGPYDGSGRIQRLRDDYIPRYEN